MIDRRDDGVRADGCDIRVYSKNYPYVSMYRRVVPRGLVSTPSSVSGWTRGQHNLTYIWYLFGSDTVLEHSGGEKKYRVAFMGRLAIPLPSRRERPALCLFESDTA